MIQNVSMTEMRLKILCDVCSKKDVGRAYGPWCTYTLANDGFDWLTATSNADNFAWLIVGMVPL